MGASIGKQWITQGYYPDMVEGYVSNAGGYTRMIRYPKNLLHPPNICSRCNSSKGLKWNKMYDRLEIQRKRFQYHADAIVAERRASGDPNPYPGVPKELLKSKSKQSLFSKITNRNGVAPEKPPTPEEEDKYDRDQEIFDFQFDVEDLIVCKCMKVKISEPEEDEPVVDAP